MASPGSDWVKELEHEINHPFVMLAFGWQTVNFSYGKSGFINAIYMSKSGKVLLVFQDGRLLESPLLTDDGKVKKVRWIPFEPGDEIPIDDIAILIAEAVALRS